MECRRMLETLLRANAALCAPARPACRLRRAHRRSIHFAPGPTSPRLRGAGTGQHTPGSSAMRGHWRGSAFRGTGRRQGLSSHARTPPPGPRTSTRSRLSSSPPRPPPEAKATSLTSLTQVCDVLGVSAQRRKGVRLTVCPQATQHHVWRGALEAVLVDLQSDLASLDSPSPAARMAEQIASACTRFLSDTATSSSPSWMRPTPFRKPAEPPPQAKKWQEVLDMFTDLARSLETDGRLAGQAQKVGAMKEGLYQIRDVVIERDIAFKEARRQDCLVQRKLSKSLGHSSRCLYTLLLFYLYGTVRDIDVHVGKCVSGKGGMNVAVHATKFLTDGDELTVRSGVKQLSHVLGIFRFVWEAANTHCDAGNHNGNDVVVKKKNEDAKGVLELQGHLWSFGVEHKTDIQRRCVPCASDPVTMKSPFCHTSRAESSHMDKTCTGAI